MLCLPGLVMIQVMGHCNDHKEFVAEESRRRQLNAAVDGRSVFISHSWRLKASQLIKRQIAASLSLPEAVRPGRWSEVHHDTPRFFYFDIMVVADICCTTQESTSLYSCELILTQAAPPLHACLCAFTRLSLLMPIYYAVAQHQ